MSSKTAFWVLLGEGISVSMNISNKWPLASITVQHQLRWKKFISDGNRNVVQSAPKLHVESCRMSEQDTVGGLRETTRKEDRNMTALSPLVKAKTCADHVLPNINLPSVCSYSFEQFID